MQRRTLLRIIGATAVGVGVGGLPSRASAATVIKLGTLAPKASAWGKVFATWVKAVSDKSGGALELQIFYNGQQGDEAAMVAKIKSGQLDGAMVSGVGLGKIYKPILALQMPGLFSSWTKLDAARTAMKAEFEKGVSDAGFFLAGWGDIGQARMMAKGFAVAVPDDVKGKKPFVGRDNPIASAVYSVIGGVTPTPLNIPEVLPNLNTGAINLLNAPCLIAEQLQWPSKLDNITADPVAMAIGAVALSSKSMDALPADLRTILTDTGKVAAAAMTTKIRNEDDAAFGRLKQKMTVTTLTADQKTKWAATFQQARQKLAQGTFSADLVSKLEGFS